MNKSRTNSLIQDMNKTILTLRTSLNPQQLNQLVSTQKLSSSFYLKNSSKHRKNLSFFSPQRSKVSKLSQQKQQARHRYIKLTNLTKQQQTQKIWDEMNNKSHSNSEYKKNWSYKHYKGNNKIQNIQKTFSIIEPSTIIQPFPQNNKKYNIQFLPRTLQGTSPKKPQYISPNIVKFTNFPKRFSLILKQKQKYNQTFYLRESLFGKTDVDRKRDRVMDMYQLQTNPFKTPKSNQLIAKMKKEANLNIDV